MKINALVDHFVSRSKWVNPRVTVDRVIIGDPDADVTRCWVTWMPSLAALTHVAEQGGRLLICHEPTFWNHPDDRPADDREIQAKMAFITRHRLTIVRIHDCWDRWPEIGIPWAWARFLGVGSVPVAFGLEDFQHRYDIPPVSLGDFARRVAACCARVGEPLVQVTGDLAQTVSRIGIGTGCLCDIAVFRQMGCDCSIVSDDGSCYWSVIQRAADSGHPVIRVHHGTSEEAGMVTLTDYINTQIEGLRAEHLPHHNTFQLVGGDAPRIRAP